MANRLLVKKLHPDAKLPTVANPGEDLAYDLYALEDVYIGPGLYPQSVKVRTGIAAKAVYSHWAYGPAKGQTFESHEAPLGLIIKDRSSMAAKGVFTHGGVIDPGYTGEILVLMSHASGYQIKAGDKIAQMVPIPVSTGEVIEVEDLGDSARGGKGFGASGQ